MLEISLLRPWWLAALPPVLLLGWWLWRRRSARAQLLRICDPHLLPSLLDGERSMSEHLLPALALLSALLCVFALAGPSLGKRDQPFAAERSGRVLVLDLSPSMRAVDALPNRLERARIEIDALFERSHAMQLGLVVFAADAFAVAPMTRDVATLRHFLPSLSPEVMPRAGARPDRGLEVAGELLAASSIEAGEVILVGDSGGDARAVAAARALREGGHRVSVLAIGATPGAPVRTASGALALNAGGEVVLVGADVVALSNIADAGGGTFAQLGAGAGEATIANGPTALAVGLDNRVTPLRSARPRDDGIWLVVALLPLAALAFRRGWLLCAVLFIHPFIASDAQAIDWPSLWQRAEQRIVAALDANQPARAIALADALAPNSRWRAIALYRAGRFAEAAEAFARDDSAWGHFNRGNALVATTSLPQALAAYESALRHDPTHRDAQHNYAIVAAALRARQRVDNFRQGDGALAPNDPPRGARQEPGSRRNATANGNRTGGSASSQPAQRRSAAAGSTGTNDEQTDQRMRRGIARARALTPLADDTAELLRQRFALELAARDAVDRDTGAPW